MLDHSKFLEFFDPLKIGGTVHILGCGATGSHIAMDMARIGVRRVCLYDFDIVNVHNIANQIFQRQHVGTNKALACAGEMKLINDDIDIRVFERGYTSQPLSGYVFLCMDNIDTTRTVVESNRGNTNIRAVFNTRMDLTSAQLYAADWMNSSAIDKLLKTMQFTQEEVKAERPVSACGTTLSIISTVKMITACATSNFINFINTGELKKFLVVDTFGFNFLVK